MIFKMILKITDFYLVRNGLRRVFLRLTTALLFAGTAACTQTDRSISEKDLPTSEFNTVKNELDTELSPGDIPSRAPSDCPGLDSQLFQLAQDEDPPSLAESLGFRVKNGKVQVLIILANEETSFLKDFQIELGTQAGNQVQAFVPFDRLCELAKNEAVLAIRRAAQAVP